MAELLHMQARGHPAIRASHHKTLELSADPSITERASCVVGVAATLPSVPVAGPLRMTLSVGTETVTCHAIGNSLWKPGGSAVIRRSGERLEDTFATDCDLTAADLPRSFAAALTDPAATLTVRVERGEPRPGGTLVRLRLGGTTGSRLAAELAAADLVLAEDAGARSAVRTAGDGPDATAVLAGGGRVLSLGTAGGTGPGVARLLTAAGTVEVLGLPAELAVTAAAADPGPELVALQVGTRELAALAAAHPDAAVVFRSAAAELPTVLAGLGRGDAALVLATAGGERPQRGRQSQLAIPARGELICRVSAVADTDRPPVEAGALVDALLAQQVTPRSIALALAQLPGWSRKRAYELVLDRGRQGG